MSAKEIHAILKYWSDNRPSLADLAARFCAQKGVVGRIVRKFKLNPGMLSELMDKSIKKEASVNAVIKTVKALFERNQNLWTVEQVRKLT